MKISIELQGGLGNQLFQIFTAYSYSLHYGCELVLPYRLLTVNRKTYWDNFLEDFRIYLGELRGERYEEVGFGYLEIPQFKEDMILRGYFQSYKYFEEDVILRFFVKKQEEVRRKYGSLFDKRTVGVHFRLGDYKGLVDYHPILSCGYYEECLKRVDVERVLYFCEVGDNELVWGMVSRFNREFGIEFMKVRDEIEDWEQLLIMSCCDVNIIANSTFSWWGGYLGRGMVYYPSRWFGMNLNYDIKDLIPVGWNRVEC